MPCSKLNCCAASWTTLNSRGLRRFRCRRVVGCCRRICPQHRKPRRHWRRCCGVPQRRVRCRYCWRLLRQRSNAAVHARHLAAGVQHHQRGSGNGRSHVCAARAVGLRTASFAVLARVCGARKTARNGCPTALASGWFVHG